MVNPWRESGYSERMAGQRRMDDNPHARLPSWVRATCGFPVGDGFSPSDPLHALQIPVKDRWVRHPAAMTP